MHVRQSALSWRKEIALCLPERLVPAGTLHEPESNQD
jgi:hypothetical protein